MTVPGRRRYVAAYLLFLSPALLLFLVFFLYPFAQSLYVSFTDQYGYNRTSAFVGLDNYLRAIADEDFHSALLVTFRYTLFVALAGNACSLLLALLVDSRIPGRGALRTVFFLPNLMSLIIVGFVWTFLYGDVYRSIVRLAGNPGWLQIGWLGNPDLAVYSVGAAAIWQTAGYAMIIYIAGLNAIPKDMLEAGRIDGASPLQLFWRIKIPLLSPVIVMNLILSATAGLKAFDFPLAMTSGGPMNATTTAALHIYTLGFRSQLTGYATAVSVLLFVLIAAVTAVLMRVLRLREETM